MGDRIYRPGEELTADMINKVADSLVSRITGGKGFDVRSFSNQIIISKTTRPRRRIADGGLIYAVQELWNTSGGNHDWTVIAGQIDPLQWSATHNQYGWFKNLPRPWPDDDIYDSYAYLADKPTNPSKVNMYCWDFPGSANPQGGPNGLVLGTINTPTPTGVPYTAFIRAAAEYFQPPIPSFRAYLRIYDSVEGKDNEYLGNAVNGWPLWGTNPVIFNKTGPGAYTVSFQGSNISITGAHDIDMDLYPTIEYYWWGALRTSYECYFSTSELS